MKVQRKLITLENGLRVQSIHVPGLRSCAIEYSFISGTRFNPKGKEGLAHFFEHLMLRQTKKYPSNSKLAEAFESLGAYKNGSTGRDDVRFTLDCPLKSLDKSLAILSELIFNPLIDEEAISSERKIIQKEIIRKDSQPESLVWDKWFSIFFAGTPLKYPNLGTEKSIKGLGKDDFLKFWKEVFVSDKALLTVSGGASIETTLKFVKKHFSSKELNKDRSIAPFKYSKSKRYILEYKDLPQTSLLISFWRPGGAMTEDSYKFIFLKNIISAGWSSRISKRLRVKESLIYSWGSGLHRWLDTGAFTLHLSTEKGKVKKLLKILSEELAKFKEDGPTNEEMKLYRNFIEGRFWVGLQSDWDYLNYYSYDEFLWPGTIESPEDRIKNIKAVTKKEVQKLAQNYLTNHNWKIAVVGDNKESDIVFDLS